MRPRPRDDRPILSAVPAAPAAPPASHPADPVSPSLRLEEMALSVVYVVLDRLAPSELRMALLAINDRYGGGS